jgi:hypothetical protein
MYAPMIKSARRVREHILDANHTAVLLTNIETNSTIEYTHLVAVFRRGKQDPIAFISSEAKSKPDNPILKELGLDGIEFTEEPGSHFLCAFVEDGHRNFGASDEWADLEKFEVRALDLIRSLQILSRRGD